MQRLSAPEPAPKTDDGHGEATDVAALVRGDPGAVEAFYRELLDPVYAFVFWRVGGVRQDAEDVTQETFLVALREIRGFARRSSLYTWVCGIAKNLARERLRGRARDDRLAVADEALVRQLAALGSAPLADGVLARQETEALVGTALSELPPHYQRALLEKYVDDRSFADMARTGNRTAKAVESTVQRAKQALLEALGRLGLAGGSDG